MKWGKKNREFTKIWDVNWIKEKQEISRQGEDEIQVAETVRVQMARLISPYIAIWKPKQLENNKLIGMGQHGY